MNKLYRNEKGFIPMLLFLLFVIGAIIFLAFRRVASQQ